mgnify:CR=1 FL=1
MSDLYDFGYTIDETLKTMKETIDVGECDRMFIDTYHWLKILKDYMQIRTIGDCKNAMQKQRIVKPKFLHMLNDTRYKARCKCGRVITADIDFRDNPKFCSECGAEFDWSAEE